MKYHVILSINNAGDAGRLSLIQLDADGTTKKLKRCDYKNLNNAQPLVEVYEDLATAEIFYNTFKMDLDASASTHQ